MLSGTCPSVWKKGDFCSIEEPSGCGKSMLPEPSPGNRSGGAAHIDREAAVIAPQFPDMDAQLVAKVVGRLRFIGT